MMQSQVTSFGVSQVVIEGEMSRTGSYVNDPGKPRGQRRRCEGRAFWGRVLFHPCALL